MRMRIYKFLPLAFLYQATVGALCIASISISGPVWIATLALLGLRPLLLKQDEVTSYSSIWQFYYKIGKISFVVVAITIILIYARYELFSHSSPVTGLWLLFIPPYFIFIHGIIGLIYTINKKCNNGTQYSTLKKHN